MSKRTEEEQQTSMLENAIYSEYSKLDKDIDKLYEDYELDQLDTLGLLNSQEESKCDDLRPIDTCSNKQLRSIPSLSISSSPQASQMTLKHAFRLLLNAEQGILEEDIPIKQSASPIVPSITCFYVSPTNSGTKKRKLAKVKEDEEENPISVKYQSFYNSEVYWSPNHEYLTGICARGMSRKSRNPKDSGSRIHGFNGRWFTLLRRSEVERDSDTSKSTRSYVVSSYSLVQFWKDLCDEVSTPGRASIEHSAVDSESISSDQVSTDSIFYTRPSQTVKGNLLIKGDLSVAGNLTMQNLHVKGDLIVEGSISGQLVTPPGAADYAEWFMFLLPKEHIQTGMVVQLRSPEQKITLDTSGEGPLLVVSTTPSVAAGVPSGNRASKGALCAFIGQVPVKVKGKVNCGDFLFPSQQNDGYAVSGSYLEHRDIDPIGTAMASSDKQQSTILAFVRWQHNLKWQIISESIQKKRTAIGNIWFLTFVPITFMHLVSWNFLYYRPQYVVDRVLYFFIILSQLFAMGHYPDYVEYVYRGDVYVFCTIDTMWGIWTCTHLAQLMQGGQEEFGPVIVYVIAVCTYVVAFCYCSWQLYITFNDCTGLKKPIYPRT